MARPIEYSLRSDLAGATPAGVRLATLDAVVADPGPEDFFHIKRHEYTFDIELGRQSAAWAQVSEERVVHIQNSSTATDFDEWRIRDIVEGIDRGRTFARLECVAPVFDLDRSGIMEWVAADGTVLTHFEALARTPTTILNIILGNVAPYVSSPPAHFKLGTIDPTALVDFVFEDDTAWTAVLELAKLTGTEFWWDRDPADDQYRIHLLNQIGSTAEEVRFEVSRNVFAFEHRKSTDESLTRVTPVGSTIAGERASIAGNAWQISTLGPPLTMVDALVLENGQLEGMGLYAEKPGGVLTAVSLSAAPDQVTLADASGLSAGDLIRFRRDATGADMSWLSSPLEEAKIPNPPIAATLPRPDIPPIDNEVTNAFLMNGWGALPTGYGQLGAATITKNTNELRTNFGGVSARVVCPNAGDGIAALAISVSPTAKRPFFTPQCWMEVISGKVDMQLVDVTDPANPITYPDITATERAITPGLGWQGLGIQQGIDHYTNGKSPAAPTTLFEIHFIAAESSTEFYLDGVMLTNTNSGVAFDAFIDGRGSNLLWLAGNDELAVRPVGLSTYQANVADLNRLDATKWPNEPIEMGGDARLVASSLDDGGSQFEASTRVLGRRRFLEHEARGEVELETERERLTRKLTERKRRAKKNPTLDHLKPPRCGLNLKANLLGADLIVEWDRTNWARVQLRDITGLTGTPRERWDAGVVLMTEDTTKWSLVEGETTDQGASPGQIKTVMIEAYNHWGKPGECLEEADTSVVVGLFRCNFPNLLPDATAGQKHCTSDVTTVPAVGTPPIVLHGFNPLAAAASPSITPGVTTISLCHEGSTTGTGALAGFGSYALSIISGFTHHMYGLYLAADEWQRARTIFGPAPSSRLYVACSIMQESGQIRQYHAGGAVGTAPDYLENRLTSTHVGEVFRPGVAITQEDIDPGDTATSRIEYSNGHLGDILTVEDLSSHKIRLTRNSGDKWLAAVTVVTGTQTGSGTLDARAANDRAGGYWDKLEILDASDVVVETFLGTDHPRGKIWMGDVFRLGSGFTISPLCLGVNAAGTLCLEQEGYQYSEDWTIATSIDPAKYQSVGMTLVPGVGLEGSAGAELVAIGVGQSADLTANAVVNRISGNSSAPPGAAVLFGAINDIQATLRATFDDGTIVEGAGVSTGDLNTFASESVLTDYLWPLAATQLTVEQLHKGTDPGEACSKNVQLNIGPQCCTYVDPSGVLRDIPSPSQNCLLTASAGILGVDTCSGGLGVQLSIVGQLDTLQTCANMTAANGYYFEFLFFEESDPVNFPGVFDWIRTDMDPLPIPPITVGGPPLPFVYVTRIAAEDPYGYAPVPGRPRGRDGIAPLSSKQWYVIINIRNTFLNKTLHATAQSAPMASPVAYNWCP